jgi:hypothetical protein
MKEKTLRLGPLAILLTLIALAMTILSLLSFASAQADVALAERFAKTVAIRYRLDKKGQKFLKEHINDAEASFESSEEDYVLHIELKENQIIEWKIHKNWEQEEQFDDLWEGGN